MRMVAFSDIHGDWSALRNLVEGGSEFFVCAGDLTFDGKELSTAVDVLNPVKGRLFIIPGNNETPEEIQKYFPNAVHGKTLEIEGLKIGGLGGSLRTPWDTLFEWDEDYAYKILEGLGSVDVFVAHSPPKGTELARISQGIDVGSEAIRWYIEENQPEYAVVGHIHERAGVVENVGKTTVINPGKGGKTITINP